MEKKESDLIKDLEQKEEKPQEEKPQEEKPQEEKDVWKTTGYVYTPMEIKPPKAFNFSDQQKEASLGKGFKKESIITPDGQQEKSLEYKNQNTAINKDNTTHDDYYKYMNKTVIPPTPTQMPATDYHGHHVFQSKNESDYSRNNFIMRSGYKKKKTNYNALFFLFLLFILVMFLIFFMPKLIENARGVLTTEHVFDEIPIAEMPQPEEEIKTSILSMGEIIPEVWQENDYKNYGEYLYESEWEKYDLKGEYRYMYYEESEIHIEGHLVTYTEYLKGVGLEGEAVAYGLRFFGMVEEKYIEVIISTFTEGDYTGLSMELYEYPKKSLKNATEWQKLEEQLNKVD